MALRNPFGSKEASPEAPPPPLDQQLFVYKKPIPEPVPKPTVEPEQPKTKPSPLPTPADLKPPSLDKQFDLSEDALYQANFRFTLDEKEVLEDLKLQLSRELDSRVDKNDILRLGLHMLMQDYKDNGDRSYLIKKLKKRSSR